jgi:sigma-B regulation protein RsbU (phosphoserine phosphatase)
MQPAILDQVRTSLLEKRAALSDWLSRTPASQKALNLGPTEETAVADYLDQIDVSITAAEQGNLGRCTVCHDYVDTKRLVVDYTADVCLDHLSREQASGLERELEMAQVVQRGLLPSEAPEVPGLDVSAFARPAQIIGGDYFDFLTFQHGEVGWAVGDVAGHGVSASLHMAGLQALCRAVIPTSSGPAEAAARIQGLFVHNSRYPTFASLFLAAFAPSSRSLTYCNAGHNPPLLLRPGAGSDPVTRWLQPTGPAIGLVEDSRFRNERLLLADGDLLVMYTDGVVEAENRSGEAFGQDRLARTAATAGSSPAEVVRAITGALEAFLGGLEPADDVTLVVARVG